jgi:endonuclease YncB( thermonuclease family)
MGLLVCTGTIDLNQFWPSGESDGDTAHVLIKDFAYEGQVTQVFQGATVHGKPVIHKDGTVVIRWQGIDSPELHYGGKWYRQHWGQAPSVHLAAFLKDKAKSSSTLNVKVTTRVSKPNDVFDKYGRFVGDLVLDDGTNLNYWMLENGWAFPALYNSLQDDELQAFIAAGKEGKSKLLNDYSADLKLWDPALQTPHKEPAGFKYDEAKDKGPVQFPKLFRRIVTFRTDAKATQATLKDYLTAQKTQDRVFKTDEFLEQGHATPAHNLTEFINANQHFTETPAGLVFKEAPSTLLAANGQKVTNW